MKILNYLAKLSLSSILIAGLALAGSAKSEDLKVGFIYIGPTGDHGWTYEHDQGRLAIDRALGAWAKTTYVGGNGLAAMMKVAFNLNLPIQILAFSESLVMAERLGISREKAAEVLLNSVLASPALKYRFPFVLEPPEEPLFDVDMMQKDVLLALEAGRQLGVPLPTTAVTNEFLTAARGMGLAGEDFAIIHQVLRKMST